MKLQRVLVGETGQITIQAPGVPTVTLTRASTGEQIGPVEATLIEGDLYGAQVLADEVEILTVDWSVGDGWSARTVVEAVGGFLFSIPELAAMRLNRTTVGDEFTKDELVTVRLVVETALEDACSVAFVPRLAVETVRGDGSYFLPLKRTHVRRVRTVNGEPTTVTADVAGIALGDWRRGRSYTLAYEHGHDYPPPRVSRAGLLLAKRWLVDGPVDDRATSITSESGTTTLLITPGMRGHLFDLPEVNAVVAAYDSSVAVA